MTLRSGKQMIAMHYCPTLQEVRQVDNEIHQVTQYNVTNIFLLKNHAEIEAGRIVCFCLFFKKALTEVRANGMHLNFSI